MLQLVPAVGRLAARQAAVVRLGSNSHMTSKVKGVRSPKADNRIDKLRECDGGMGEVV